MILIRSLSLQGFTTEAHLGTERWGGEGFDERDTEPKNATKETRPKLWVHSSDYVQPINVVPT